MVMGFFVVGFVGILLCFFCFIVCWLVYYRFWFVWLFVIDAFCGGVRGWRRITFFKQLFFLLHCFCLLSTSGIFYKPMVIQLTSDIYGKNSNISEKVMYFKETFCLKNKFSQLSSFFLCQTLTTYGGPVDLGYNMTMRKKLHLFM